MCMAESPTRPILVVDVREMDPDLRTVETLARLQLAARRGGASIRLRHACPMLCNLLAWAGLAELLPPEPLPAVGESGVEGDRLVEQREELVVDEEVDPGDPAV
jgi:hypothetical protein